MMLARRGLSEEEAARLLDLPAGHLPGWTQGLVITDPSLPDNPIIYANEGFRSLTGYAPEEIIGRNCRFLQGQGSDHLAIAEIRAALQRDERIDRDILNYRKDGTAFWNHLSLGPLDTRKHGRLMVGLQFDVSFRHRRI